MNLHQLALSAAVISLAAWKFRKTLLILFLALTVGATIYSLREFSQSTSLIAEQIGKVVEIEVIVTSDPHRSAPKVIGSRLLDSRTSFLARSESISTGESKSRLRVPIRVLCTQSTVSKGQRLLLRGKVIESKERRVAALVRVTTSIKELTAPSRWDLWLNSIRDDFSALAADRGSDGARLIPGLVAGDTRLESQEFLDSMRRSGLAHLTAVSGANFAIVTAFILWLTGWLTRRKSIRAAIAVIFVILFLELVRPTASVLRAAVMALVIIIARLSGSRSISATSLSVAIAAVLIADPYQGFDPGFVLSVLATSALIFIAPRIQEWLERFLAPLLAEAVAVAAAATLACTPYLIFLAGSVSLGSIFFNITVAPVVAPVTILGFLSMATLPVSQLFSGWCFTLAQPLADWIVRIASLNRAVPSISLAPIFVIVMTATLIWLSQRSKLIALCCALSFLTFFSIQRAGFPGTDWKVGQCDVGQGDALLIRVAKRSAILFDGGPDPRLLQSCLRQFHVDALPLVILSHHHADHYQGLISRKDLHIGVLWINSVGANKGIPAKMVHLARAGDTYFVGKAKLKVLWPISGQEEFSSIAGDGSIENNRSIVVRVEIDGISLLVTGDVEPDAQKAIAFTSDLEGISIVKVPHHGSKYQSHDFLAKVNPKLALISVGARNGYGHPATTTIEELRHLGAQVFRTDLDGAIGLSWRADQDKYVFSVRREGKEWWRIRWL